MSRLRDILVRQYAEHYSRINESVDPRALTDRSMAMMSLMYGDIIASLPPGSRILDLGCGTGFLLNWLSRQPGITAIGVDGSATQVDIARRCLPEVEVVCEDGLEFLNRNQKTFSGIFCTDVLEHIYNEDNMLAFVESAREALLNGGFFFCRMPNAANLTATYSRYIDLTHERSFTSASILQLLEAAGLRDCRIVPIRMAHMSGRIRLVLERLIHRAIFRLCGHDLEKVFTSNVCAIGYRK